MSPQCCASCSALTAKGSVSLAPQRDNPALCAWILLCQDPGGYLTCILFIHHVNILMLTLCCGPAAVSNVMAFSWPPIRSPQCYLYSTIFALLLLSTSWPFLSHLSDFCSATFAPPLFHICIVAFKIICQHLDVDIFCGPTIGPLHQPPTLAGHFSLLQSPTSPM